MGSIKRRIKSFLLNLFYRKLWVKIAVILFVIVTIPAVLLGVLLINTSQEAVRNSVLDNHREIAVRAAEEIGLFIKGPESILGTTAAMLEVVYPAPWKQETLLVELALYRPIFMRIASVDLSGTELASSELGRRLNWRYLNEVLQKIKIGENYISQVEILDNHTPYVTMAVPIRKMGKIIGGLIADVDLRGMWKIVDGIKLGKTGRAFLVSSDGTLIAHQDKRRVLKNENLRGEMDVRAVLAGRTEAIELQNGIGKKWIASYAPIPASRWGIVLRQEQDEAYLFSKVMKAQSWMIIILSELAAVVISIFMARVLVRPIKTLASRIKRVAGGDLDYKIGTRRRDEIGELIKSYNDMTEKLKRARARERLSAIGEAASWIAHELKNSLVSIKAFVQMFPSRHKDEEFVDKFSRLIPEEIIRWEHMLKQVSNFSSQSELKTEKTNLKELIHTILEIMEEQFIEKKINVRYSPQNGEHYIVADPEKLKQVFMNLIINAINAMPGGGSLIVSVGTVDSETLSGPAHVEVRIRDTGKGIPKDMSEKIFEPFYTIEKGGMGLGLSISRSIVEQHGGNIRVESEIDMGATFIVRLPVDMARQERERR